MKKLTLIIVLLFAISTRLQISVHDGNDDIMYTGTVNLIIDRGLSQGLGYEDVFLNVRVYEDYSFNVWEGFAG